MARTDDIHSLADEEVMHLVQQGNARAFELLYDRHGGAAFSLAYRMVGNRVAAEDVAQEAFLSIWRSRLRYQPERGSVRTWVLGIVHHRGDRRAAAQPRARPPPGRASRGSRSASRPPSSPRSRPRAARRPTACAGRSTRCPRTRAG